MSIQASELRVNNIVTNEWYESFKTIIIIDSVNERGINIVASDDNKPYGMATPILDYEYKLEELRGIPLTDEVLEGLGFQSHNHFTVTNSKFIDLGRNRQLSIGCAGTPNEMVCLTEIDNERKNVCEIICLRNYDYDGKTYAHHIQNLYHSLTGNELTLSKPF